MCRRACRRPRFRAIGLGQIGALSGGAIALALVALAESIGTARSLAAQRGYEIDPNQELVALGASNVGAGLLQGFPVDASLSRSAVGAGAGVRTRLSGLFVALLIVATMLFLTPLFDGLPQATLAAIIIAAVIGLVDVARVPVALAHRPGATPGSRSWGSPPLRCSASCPASWSPSSRRCSR